MNIKSLAAIALTIVIVCPIALGYAMSVSEEDVTGWETVESNNISDLLLNHNTPYDATYYGTTNNTILATSYNASTRLTPTYVSVTNNITPYPEIQSPQLTLYPTDGRIPLPLAYSWTWDAGTEVHLYYEKPVPGTEYTEAGGYGLAWNSSGYTLIYDASEHTLSTASGDRIFSDTREYTSISIRSTEPVTIFREVYTGQYADVTAGWTLPLETCYWLNDQTVSSVTFTVNLPAGASLVIGEFARVTVTNDGGITSVDGTPLGAYQYLRITVTDWTTTVAGLSGWPAMGSNPATFNSTTVTYDGLVYPNQYGLMLKSSTAAKPILRVDSAQIVAGTFPSTLDYDLKLQDLYPGKTLNLKLNSIGVYGDYLQIGDVSLPITNGTVTLGGKTIGLRGALLSFFEEDGNIEAMINNSVVGSFANLPTVRFGGEWSLTATVYILEETTNTKMTWHAGEFGLDKSGLAAAGLIFAGIAFLVLGMNGRRSGAKVGLLLLICGGAAAVYIMLI